MTPEQAQRLRDNAARYMDATLEQMSAAAHKHGLESLDQRWTTFALALRGVRQFARPLMADADKQGDGDANPRV